MKLLNDPLSDKYCQAGECCDDWQALSVVAQDHGDDEADGGADDACCRGKDGRDRHHGKTCVWHVVEKALYESAPDRLLEEHEWQHPDQICGHRHQYDV